MSLVGTDTRRKPNLQEIEEHNKQYPEEIRYFAAGHYLADLPYHLAIKDALPSSLYILSEDGSVKKYFVHQIPLKKDLFGYILLPEDKNCRDIKVTFRGTAMFNLGSWVINFEPEGPGTISFEQEKDRLFHFLNTTLHEHYGEDLPPLNVGVYGHSQGASLAQLFATELLTRRAAGQDYDAIQKLVLTTLNTPGVPRTTSLQAAAALKQQCDVKPIQVIANYGIVGGDAVQTLSETMLFHGLPSNEVTLNLLKIKGFEGNWCLPIDLSDGIDLIDLVRAGVYAAYGLFGGHSNVNFFGIEKGFGEIFVGKEYAIYSNKKPEDLATIEKELTYKLSQALSWSYWPRKILYHFWKLADDWQIIPKYTPNFIYRLKDWASAKMPKTVALEYTLDEEGFISPVCPSQPIDSSIPGAQELNEICFPDPYLSFYRGKREKKGKTPKSSDIATVAHSRKDFKVQ